MDLCRLCRRPTTAAERLEPLALTITQAPLTEAISITICAPCLLGDLVSEAIGVAICEYLDGARRAAGLSTLLDSALGIDKYARRTARGL